MTRGIPHSLPTRNIGFSTKGKYEAHFKKMMQKYRGLYTESKQPIVVSETNDTSDLIDFLTLYSDKREQLAEDYDYSKAIFVFKKSPKFGSECFYILQNDHEEQFSVTNFGNPPKPYQNFLSYCRYAIKDIKQKIRKHLVEPSDTIADNDLYHKQPKFIDTVWQFINKHELEENLENMLSNNESSENVPKLLPEFEYIHEKFIQFYKEVYTDYETQFELKPVKK